MGKRKTKYGRTECECRDCKKREVRSRYTLLVKVGGSRCDNCGGIMDPVLPVFNRYTKQRRR